MSPSLLALMAAASFALGSALQQRGALQTSAGEGDPRFLLQLTRRPAWLGGAGLQALGWVLQALALRDGSLVVVQSLCTLSIVFALPFGAALTAQRIGRRSLLGAGCTVLGIIGFLVVGGPQASGAAAEPAALVGSAAVGGVAMIVLARIGARRQGPQGAVLFATGAGVSYGFQGAATKSFMGQLGGGLGAMLAMPATYVLIVTALAGFALQQSALKTGFLAPALAASNAATLVASIVLGLVLFGEALAATPAQLPVAIAALVLAVAGVVILAAPDVPVPDGAARDGAREEDAAERSAGASRDGTSS